MEEKWNYFKEKLTKAAEDTVRVKIIKGGKKNLTQWWTGELTAAVTNKMQKFRKWMKTRQPEDRENYVLART